jgi:uncharacterized membrane protein
MNNEIQFFLNKFKHQLRSLPEIERVDAIKEIEGHISEGIQAGESPTTILTKFGDPKVLAKAYLAEYYFQKSSGNFTSFLLSMFFFLSTGFTSIIVVPFLSLITLSFSLSSIVIIGAGILRTIGLKGLRMDLGSWIVPNILSIPFSIVIAGICLLISLLSWKLLRLYFQLIMTGYRRISAKIKIEW